MILNFRCTIFAIVIAILCACSLWKKRRQICGWGSPRPHSQSGDSTGSCYAPPQYSRCTSFHHAPPPYAEVCTHKHIHIVTCLQCLSQSISIYSILIELIHTHVLSLCFSLSGYKQTRLVSAGLLM